LGTTVLEAQTASSERALVVLRTDADLLAPAATLDVQVGSPLNISPAEGDPVKLELGYDSSLATVFTGTVDQVRPNLLHLHVQALADPAKLLYLRVNQVYENQTAGQVISDLAGQAGVTTGAVQSGLDLPFYTVDDARSAYHHCRDLAERTGFDLYTTPDGKLNFAAFSRVAPDHTFFYAQDVLSLEVATLPQRFARVEVWGESPASAEGTEAASWLARDFASFLGTAGSGTALRISDPAIRTKDAAAASAKGRLADLTRRAIFGVAVILGNGEVALGDAVTFLQTPDDRLGGVLQVKRVTHSFSKSAGFTTRLELWGSGGGLL
jgi:phage protein D